MPWVRSALAHGPKGQRGVVAAAPRQAFLPADQESARQGWRRVADRLHPRRPRLAAPMDGSEPAVPACVAFPAQHRAKPPSTDPLERSNKEVKRRADGVGIVPTEASITRPVGAAPLEANDAWPLRHRRMPLQARAELMPPLIEGEVAPATAAAIPPQAA